MKTRMSTWSCGARPGNFSLAKLRGDDLAVLDPRHDEAETGGRPARTGRGGRRGRRPRSEAYSIAASSVDSSGSTTRQQLCRGGGGEGDDHGVERFCSALRRG